MGPLVRVLLVLISKFDTNVNRAGGPGDSAEDVKWLDEMLKEFFEKEKIEDSKDKALQMLQEGMSSLKV
jgi:hypothetical protein